ncbi:MAG: cupin domain-containing protein [Elusimicrobia bacterium]|nr:cupin domain-containing protein [Elusimicrobiota bacterium]
MRLMRTRVDFRDSRGAIRDILDGVHVNAVTLVTSKRGSSRGNHFHKKTTQYLYVLDGRLRYVSRKGKGALRSVILRPGDIAVSPPGEAHAVVALEDSSFIAISWGPRHGKNYEADTFRAAVAAAP